MEDRCKNCGQMTERGEIIARQHSDLFDILNDSRDILYRYNFDTNSYDYLTGNVEKMTGYTHQQIKETGIDTLLDSLHPDDKEAFMRTFEGLANSTIEASELRLEYRTRHKEGHYIHRSDHLRIIRNTDGKITAIIGNNRDITPRRTTEQKLKASEERYRRLAQATFEGVLIHDRGTILDVNKQFCDMFRCSREDVLGTNCFELVAPQSHELVQHHVTNGFQGPYEAFSQKKDGTIFPVEVHAREISQDGKTQRIATFRDLTEQKKLQQQLMESEKKYRELYNNAHVALFRTGLDGMLLDCNRATLGFFGYSLDETGYLGNYSVVDAYVDKKRRQEFIELLTKNKRVSNFEVQLHHQNGTRFWASIDAELYAEEGYIEGALYNITAEKVLTKTEKEILEFVLQSKTNKDIAAETNRSIRTIEDHRSHIMRKLGANSLVDLTQKAILMGFWTKK